MRVDDETAPRWWTLLVTGLLWRLVRDSEFAAEIRHLSLRPAHVLQKLLADPLTAAALEHAYEPVAERHHAVRLHRGLQPEPFPQEWSPTRSERYKVRALALVPPAWIVLVMVFGSLVPTWAIVVATLIVASVLIYCGLTGLPPDAHRWVRWATDHYRLALHIPRHWWRQGRGLRHDVLVSALREWLRRQTTPSFDHELHLRDAKRLTLPAGEGTLVHTAAVKACSREVNRAKPGAVSLAGSRGCRHVTRLWMDGVLDAAIAAVEHVGDLDMRARYLTTRDTELRACDQEMKQASSGETKAGIEDDNTSTSTWSSRRTATPQTSSVLNNVSTSWWTWEADRSMPRSRSLRPGQFLAQAGAAVAAEYTRTGRRPSTVQWQPGTTDNSPGTSSPPSRRSTAEDSVLSALGRSLNVTNIEKRRGHLLVGRAHDSAGLGRAWERGRGPGSTRHRAGGDPGGRAR
ncbi:hypothetical protein M8C13_19200 [Crossiella sp. SN42]|uniref:hypothetical protein n=1 Tax=Crossiella sp. SN42 TaxID=2944808 RepID=UPI00207D5F27|nr:hypothetical protein [Crossiella sp. SN42]MCO1577884.1 hypothetical protein [Crossiella sp. SN42]